MPPSRAASRAARSSSSEGARPTGSTGVQTAPRANTPTPLTCRSRPAVSASWRSPGPPARARKPTRPASTATASPSRSTSSRASYSAGSPCVCGHQRGGPGNLERPLGHRVHAVLAQFERRPGALIAPAHLDLDRARAALVQAAQARPHRQHAPRRPPAAGAAAARRRRDPGGAPATPAATARPARGPGAKPGARPSIVVRKKRRFWFATTRVRQRARGRRRSRSSGSSARQRIASSL